MKLFLTTLYVLASPPAALLFASEGSNPQASEVQIGLKTVGFLLVLLVIGMQMWSNQKELAALKRDMLAYRQNNHKMRNNYMTVLLGFNMVVQVILELTNDHRHRERIMQIRDEVGKQMRELQEQARQQGVEPPWVRATD